MKMNLIRALTVAGMLAMSAAAHAGPLADLYLYLMGGGGK
jgi:hypothetical protein